MSKDQFYDDEKPFGEFSDFYKSQVKAHTRTLKSGKVVNVRSHSDKRTRKSAAPSLPASVKSATPKLPAITPPEGWTPAPEVLTNWQPGSDRNIHTNGRGFKQNGKYYKPEFAYGPPEPEYSLGENGFGTFKRQRYATNEFAVMEAVKDLPATPQNFRRVAVNGEPYIEMPIMTPMSPDEVEDMQFIVGNGNNASEIEETLREMDRRGISYGDNLQLFYDDDRDKVVIGDFSNAQLPVTGDTYDQGNRYKWEAAMNAAFPRLAARKKAAVDAATKRYGISGALRRYIYAGFNRPSYIGLEHALTDYGAAAGSFEIADTGGRTDDVPHMYVFATAPLPQQALDRQELILLKRPSPKMEDRLKAEPLVKSMNDSIATLDFTDEDKAFGAYLDHLHAKYGGKPDGDKSGGGGKVKKSLTDELLELSGIAFSKAISVKTPHHYEKTGNTKKRVLGKRDTSRLVKLLKDGHAEIKKDGRKWQVRVKPKGKVRFRTLGTHATLHEAKLQTIDHFHPPAAPAKPKIENFGAKIGGSRADLATSTGKRPRREKTVDSRPAWARKYVALPEVENKWHKLTGSEPKYTEKWELCILQHGKSGAVKRAISKVFDSEAEAMLAVPLVEVSRKHSVYESTPHGTPIDQKEYAIYRNITDRKRAVVKGGFKSREEGMMYMLTHAPEIIEHKFEEPERPWLDHVERIGKTVRVGDVTPKQFHDTFGFHGGEFGNWNKGGDGQAALNYGYDALMDLAETLKLPPKALSLGGQLSIAFGARGNGLHSARAHYERSYAVINLTKIKGAGALAHEWFHGLDHFLARQDGKAATERVNGTFPAKDRNGDYLSHGAGYKSKLDAELKDSFKAFMDSTVAKESVVAVQTDREQQRAVSVSKGLAQSLDWVRDQMQQSARYNKRRGYNYTKKTEGTPATDKELAAFDAIAAKIKSGDVGEKVFVEGRSSWGGRQSFERIEELNAVFKAVTGRSFATNDDQSYGRRIFWQIKNVQEANKRVDEASAGATEVKKTATDYLRHSKDIDSTRVETYWSSPHEMAARAFEAYVQDALTAKKRVSQYLVHGASNNYYAALGLKPYPEGEERKAINAKIADLVDAIRKTGVLTAKPASSKNIP